MPFRSGSPHNVGLICEKCELDITQIQNFMQCDNCNKNYHLKCLNILGKHINLIAEETSWLCKKCKSSCQNSNYETPESLKRKSNDPHTSSSNQPKKMNTQKSPPSLPSSDDKLDKILNLMGKMEEAIQEVKVNQDFLSGQFDTLNKKIETISTDNTQLKKEFKVIKEKQIENSSTIFDILSEIDVFKQKELENNVIIGGLPNNTDPETTIMNVMKTLEMKTTIDDISELRILVNKSTSLGNTQNAQNTKNSMLVVFKNKEDKTEMIAKKKQKKTLFTYEIGLNSKRDDQVYIRDHLTSYKMQLFKDSKTLKESLKFRYLWMNGSRILLRKDETSKIYSINSKNDLEKINLIFTPHHSQSPLNQLDNTITQPQK